MRDVHYFDGEKINSHNKKNTKGEEVYHYTSPHSFISIFNDKKLWFSDSQFLNDRSEFTHIKRIINEASKIAGKKYDEKFINYLMGRDYEGITVKHKPKDKNGFSKGYNILHTRYYLLCTSVNQDTHNLWNYYVKNNNYQGYNIGISVDSLIEAVESMIKSNELFSNCKVTHGVVNYNVKMQINLLYSKILELNSKYNASEDMSDFAIDSYQEELSEYLIERCLFYKNPAFEHEREYRFVIEASTNITDYHVGSSGLIVPHLEIEFDPDKVVKIITLAPMMEQEIAKLGVQQFLKYKCKLKSEIKINFSQMDVRF